MLLLREAGRRGRQQFVGGARSPGAVGGVVVTGFLGAKGKDEQENVVVLLLRPLLLLLLLAQQDYYWSCCTGGIRHDKHGRQGGHRRGIQVGGRVKADLVLQQVGELRHGCDGCFFSRYFSNSCAPCRKMPPSLWL